MAETTSESDMSVGLGLLFGFVALFAAIAMAGTSYVAMLSENGDLMQLLSGIALAVAILAGGMAVAAIHVYD
jgi:uncharacterized protein (UPF0333 family)